MVGELRSCKPCGMAKKKEIKKPIPEKSKSLSLLHTMQQNETQIEKVNTI